MKKFIISGKTFRNIHFKLKSLLKVQYTLVRISKGNLKHPKKLKKKAKTIAIFNETQPKVLANYDPNINFTMTNFKVTTFKTAKANKYRE